MNYVLPLPPVIGIPVMGSDALFPVRRVYCLARNYTAHAVERGDLTPGNPFFFCKPADAILPIAHDATGELIYPPKTSNLHYEMELVVALGKGGKNISVEQANHCVWGYALGLDMTRRDLQDEAKKQGQPWEIGKSFDHSAPVGPLHLRSVVGSLDKEEIWLEVDGQRKQSSHLSKMIWNIPESIAYLSTLFELRPGDIIFTGTPEGVGAVKPGNLLVGGIEGLDTLRVKIVEA